MTYEQLIQLIDHVATIAVIGFFCYFWFKSMSW